MNKKDYISGIENAERRFLNNPLKIELRAKKDEEKATEVFGYAAMFGKETELGWMREVIEPGAFDDVLMDDVRCLLNHNPNYVLARSNAGVGTLEIGVDATGLWYKFEVGNQSYAQDLKESLQRGDINQSSFSFRAKETSWVNGENGQNDLRKIVKVETLFDVSPVTFPAYDDTEVALRSYNEEKPNNTDNKPFDALELQRERYKILNKI